MQQNAKAFSARLRKSACVCGKKNYQLFFQILGTLGILAHFRHFSGSCLAIFEKHSYCGGLTSEA